MGWLLLCFLTITLPLLGFSWSSVCLHVIFAGTSFCITYLFLTKEWELDFVFDFVFKLLELVGFGAPHRLENHLPCSSLYTSGSYNSLQEIPKPLEESLKKLLDNIIRDFIRSWYSDVGEEESFTDDARRAMEKLCVEGYARASQIDSHYLLEQVIVVFHGHLERFNKALQVLKAKDPKLRLNISNSQLLYQTYESQLPCISPSLSNPTGELSYLRSIIDSALAAVMPKDTFGCDTGRFILREILAVKVLDPLVTLLTEPDWINQAVIDILKQNGKTVEPRLTDNSPMGSFSGEKPSLLHSECSAAVSSISSESGSATTGVEQLDGKPGAECKEMEEKKGEKMQTTTEQGISDSVDFQWAITSQRQPPLGESEHDSESFLVISVDEDRSSGIVAENRTQSSKNWSLEVLPSSSVDDHDIVSSSLSSSWGLFPSPKDESFQTQSYQNMKGNLTHSAHNTTLGAKIGELGHSIKEMTCCHIFEESGDVSKASFQAKGAGIDLTVDFSRGEGVTTRFRTRSLSYPGQLSSDDEIKADEDVVSPSCALIRSVSVPCRLPNAVFCDHGIGNQAADPFSVFYGSTFYSTSCRSSLDSFKSVSSEDDRIGVEQGTDVIFMTDSHNSLNDSSMSLTSSSFDTSLAKLTVRKHAITKQDSFEENEQSHQTQRCELDLESMCASDDGSDVCGSLHLQTKELSAVNVTNEITSPEKTKKLSSSLPSDKVFSELSFGDAFISAGKKLVSNFKPPFKFESGSSSSTKSTETSTTAVDDSIDQPTLNHGCPLTGDHMDQREPTPDLIQSLKHGGFRERKVLSRSDAVVQESMESDLETCFGTPVSDSRIRSDEIAYSRATVAGESLPADVIRIHPSDLISIPSTVVALETTWEPGRNKYTLYKIEYDIRIWREVYSRTVKEAKKERLKQKRYASITSQSRDEDISLETVKREIPLKRIINRRYREFMELHNRLTSGILAVHMKDILRPNRKYNLPFGRLDPHVVEGRRRLLQYYLVSLVSKPPLRNSEELKQFLGVTGGEHVSFVKPSVAQIVSQSVHVPRVDKMLSRQMTKVIDSIKTAFDSVEEAELASEELSTTSGDKSFVPWKLECDQGAINIDTETDDHKACLLQDHYYAFLGACEECWPATPSSMWHPPSREQDLEGGFDEVEGPPLWAKRKQIPYDTDEDGSDNESHRIRQSLGPRTAGDGSDNPDELTACASHNSLVEVGSTRAGGAAQMHVSAHLRERAGEYLESVQSHILTKRPVGLSHSAPPSGSESTEREVSKVQTTARNKFPFGAHKILEAAKRFGQGAKSGLSLNTSSEDEKNPFKKLLRECSPSSGAKVLRLGSKVVRSPEEVQLKPEEPSAQSAMDDPSDIDDDPRGIPTPSDLQCSLLHSLLDVSLELFHEHRSWITVDRVQQGIVATFGGLFEWYLQRGIDDITTDECWAYYLDELNEAIWPGGQLQENKVKQRTDEEKIKAKKEAIYAIKDAVPGLLKLLIGSGACFKSIVNVMESLQHPQVNKILLFTLLELLLSELIPEIQDDLQFLNYICSHH